VTNREALRRKADYVARVTRGERWMPWQDHNRTSEEERTFREEVERRKETMLSTGVRVRHPVLLTEREIDQARKNIRRTDWAKRWFEGHRRIADHVVAQGDDYVERMLPEETPWTGYTFVCPNCIGVKSQEGTEYSIIDWDYRDPDLIRCKRCGHAYPGEKYPETGTLVCPRRGRTLAFYLNEEERRHPEDRSGRHSYGWARHPTHACFSGIVRERKVSFALRAMRTLALVYRITGEDRYARAVVRILDRLTDCFGTWLYHDYWDAVADCDPLYAAWHDKNLPLEWKRSLFTSAYEKDEPDRAAMLQTYWGAGRWQSSTGAVGVLPDICLAYDLIYDADGLWTPALREKVEKGLILEWVIEAEPFVGGRGRAENVSNKAPRVYHAQAAVAKCLGIPELAEVALRGYEAIRDRSFGFDGYCHEAPSYNAMYLTELLQVPETLEGFRWPEGFRGRKGAVHLYRTDPMLRLMLRAEVDQMRPDSRYLPLSDTNHTSLRVRKTPHDRAEAGGSSILEIGLRRFPEDHAQRLPVIYRYRKCDPTEYAVMHLDAAALAPKRGARKELELPELCFPNWMTAILRHGSGPGGTVLALAFNPAGGHRHYDNLTLYYADRGQALLGDLGYLWESPIQRWIRSTFSHNLVLVDDEQQLLRTGGVRRPELRMMVASPKVSVVEASSEVYPQCRDYRRLVALVKGPGAETFCVDIFRVKGGKRHDYRVFCELASSDAGREGRLSFTGVRMPAGRPLKPIGASDREEDISGLQDIRQAKRPPAAWQAVWKEKGRSHRMWMLGQVDAAQMGHGPGQEMMSDPKQVGRRVRYVDAVREGEDLSSAFVVVHEPSGPRGMMPIREAVRLEVPAEAGPEAVALRVESRWGTYLIFSEFSREAGVEGVRFRGKFGVVCRAAKGKRWMLACGARTLKAEGFGFAGAPAVWKGRVVSQTEREIVADTDRPAGWAALPEGVTSYVLAQTAPCLTGFPVKAVGKNRISVDRFPLPEARRFELMAVRYSER